MKILKNRKYAILITVAVTVLATLFGVHRSLSAEVAKVEGMFFRDTFVTDTQTGKKVLQPSIDSQLEKRGQSAAWLATLAGSYDGLGDMTNDLLLGRDMLLHATSISEKGQANVELQDAFGTLYKAFLAAGPDERDRALAEQYAATFEGAGNTIENNRYNNEVYRFEVESREFPVVFLKPLVFIREPELF